MLYKNNDIRAILECEKQRTGNYGADYDDYEDDEEDESYEDQSE